MTLTEETNMASRSIYLRNQVVTYVLFLIGRVGSTYLTHLLNSHPDIYALQEELAELKEQGVQAQLEWTRQFLTPPLVGGKRVRGFSVKKIQLLDPGLFTQLLLEKQPKIIHMQRRNTVKAVVSYLNGKRLAEKTGMWGLFDEKDRLPAFEIDPQEFEQSLQRRIAVEEDLADYVKTINLPRLELFYEDMVVDLDGFLKPLFEFLEVEPRELSAEVKKNTSDDLRRVITNFDVLKANYTGTRFEKMFDEVLVP